MEDGLFAYILRYSKRQQIILVLMTALSFPFYYLSLDLPKTIINDAISGSDFPVDIALEFAGYTFTFGSLEQVPYLLFLCFLFLFLVLVNSGFKLVINIYRGTLGERMLRRMRLQLIERIMRFPLARFRSTSQGELVSMVNQETEPLGGFIGEAYSLPLYQGGMLLTILVFMFVQDWKLGLAAIALYPLQAWLIPKLQKRVNLLNRQRTVRLRNLAENLGEVVAGINEIHINDNSSFYKDHFSKLLGGIFNIRVKIYRMKFFIKFLNNSIAQLTPFLFFLIGGLLVIRGEMTIGALVAAVAAYKDLSPPWKELLAWYQGQADARMRYTILTEQFALDDEPVASEESFSPQWLEELKELPVAASNVSLKRHDGIREINNVSLSMNSGDWISLVGTGNSGKNGLAQMFARLTYPSSGKILLADQDVTRIPRVTTGRAVSYVGHDSYLFSGSIRDNVLLSLKYQPQEGLIDDMVIDDDICFKNWQEEARLSGNSDVAINADWVDHRSAGVDNADLLTQRLDEILQTVEVEEDLVRYALERTIEPDRFPELTDRVIEARQLFKERVQSDGLESLVEFLDPEQYNDNASLADNILFGASCDDKFSAEGLAEHPVLRALLDEYGLSQTLDEAAVTSATTIVELFSDLPPGHEFFDRYNFIEAEDLPRLKRILGVMEKKGDIGRLDAADRKLLRSLPYNLIRGRHRLGILDEAAKEKVLILRQRFAGELDEASRQQIDFFAPDRYNANAPLVENIIFGRVVFGRLGAENKVYQLIVDVLRHLNLISPILDIGLSAPAGLAGGLLPVSQRQKLLLARALLKKPRVLIVNEGLGGLDSEEMERILGNVKRQYPTLSLFWVDNQARFLPLFDRVAYLKSGKIDKIEEVGTQSDDEPVASEEANAETARQPFTVEEDKKLALLKSIPLFRLMDDPHLMILARHCDAIGFSREEYLFRQGDEADCLYVIMEGKAKILIAQGSSHRVVRECGEDEVIGELAMLSDEPRTASVQAVTDLGVLRLEKDAFMDMLQSNSAMGYQVLQVVAQRLVSTNRELTNVLAS
ncbi:ABC transporter transmembrane domain-containing protein [Granulosicoccus sp. 3-233]|uniref:ABC transporter transmembrane domain-containing protein n=1 Tax=Granulosicoccus sp. 3-233 TaxID=3417969 RepID=UPI003D342198